MLHRSASLAYAFGVMSSVHDVAAYILQATGSMPAMKLQKLVYYVQAWSLVWDERPLFPEKVRAWANGPVIPELYAIHRGKFRVEPPWPKGRPARLSQESRETIDVVLKFYGKKPSDWLSQLTHREHPWRNARKGLADGERGDAEITHAALAEYYSSLG